MLLLDLAQQRAKDRDLYHAGGVKMLVRVIPAGNPGLAVGNVETDWRVSPGDLRIDPLGDPLGDLVVFAACRDALDALLGALAHRSSLGGRDRRRQECERCDWTQKSPNSCVSHWPARPCSSLRVDLETIDDCRCWPV